MLALAASSTHTVSEYRLSQISSPVIRTVIGSPGGERLLWSAQNIPDYLGIRIFIFRINEGLLYILWIFRQDS
jgi:hypothetical protein